jgi:hypothetical protein
LNGKIHIGTSGWAETTVAAQPAEQTAQQTKARSKGAEHIKFGGSLKIPFSGWIVGVIEISRQLTPGTSATFGIRPPEATLSRALRSRVERP